MRIGNRTNALINTVGGCMLLLTLTLRALRDHIPGLSVARSLVYILFFLLWCVTINRRVVQKHPRRCLTVIACMELLLILIRTVKFDFLKDVNAMRYAWYLYYLPMLMAPVFCLLLAIMMGKPDSRKPRNALALFPLLSALLFIVVITNDLHSLVFVIPPGPEGLLVGNYSYGVCYYIIYGYVWLCVTASYGIVISKCRAPNRRPAHFLPLVPMAAGAVVSVLYLFGIEVLFGVYKVDITVTICLCTTFTLEACIQNGLIPTNTNYGELFRAGGISAVITDELFVPLIASDSYHEIPAEKLREAVGSSVMLSGARLSSAPIRHGHVFWQDDLTELDNVLKELEELNDYLQGKSAAERQAYDYRKRERRLIEQNRLYNNILTQTKPEIELYAELIEKLASETDKAAEKQLALRIAFVGTFIKRRDNLIFLSEQGKIDQAELSLCIEESLSNLRLCNIDCFCSDQLSSELEFDVISGLYEKFYRLVYSVIDSLTTLGVYLNEKDGKAAMLMRITRIGDADALPDAGYEDGEWVVELC